jgi:hypothetical protein
MGNNSYLEAAEKISDLADEYSHDYQLACILRAGASRIMELSGTFIIKTASVENDAKLAANE